MPEKRQFSSQKTIFHHFFAENFLKTPPAPFAPITTTLTSSSSRAHQRPPKKSVPLVSIRAPVPPPTGAGIHLRFGCSGLNRFSGFQSDFSSALQSADNSAVWLFPLRSPRLCEKHACAAFRPSPPPAQRTPKTMDPLAPICVHLQFKNLPPPPPPHSRPSQQKSPLPPPGRISAPPKKSAPFASIRVHSWFGCSAVQREAPHENSRP